MLLEVLFDRGEEATADAAPADGAFGGRLLSSVLQWRLFSSASEGRARAALSCFLRSGPQTSVDLCPGSELVRFR